jgi:hypothetical protein
MANAAVCVPKLDEFRDTNVAGSLTGRNTTFDMPPPGAGLATVTEPVEAVAMSEPRIVAVSCEPLTNVVVRGLPFQFTTDPDTNPVPFTVSVKPAPPGATLAGISG